MAIAIATEAATLVAIFLLVFPAAAMWGSTSSAGGRIVNAIFGVLVLPGSIFGRWTGADNVYLVAAIAWGALAGILYAGIRLKRFSSPDSKTGDS